MHLAHTQLGPKEVLREVVAISGLSVITVVDHLRKSWETRNGRACKRSLHIGSHIPSNGRRTVLYLSYHLDKPIRKLFSKRCLEGVGGAVNQVL